MATPRPRGRRPKSAGDTRTAIRVAAGRLFADVGLDQTSLRALARAAGVDPSLVLHYFGSKERLFFEVMRATMAPDMESVFAPSRGRGEIGERLVEAFLMRWDAVGDGSAFSALVRAGMTNERVRELLREFIESDIRRRVAARIGGSDVDFRVGLVATQLMGLGFARYVVHLRPVAGASPGALVAAIGPTITRYLGRPLAAAPHTPRGPRAGPLGRPPSP